MKHFLKLSFTYSSYNTTGYISKIENLHLSSFFDTIFCSNMQLRTACRHTFSKCGISKCTPKAVATQHMRALSSTKSSARCMALATHFSIACRKGGKGLGTRLYTIIIGAGDKANVILAQQCCSRFNGSQQQQPWCVISNSALWCRYQLNVPLP